MTQQNASNAEESASASEELNAQSSQLKDMVGELVALVGGTAARGNGAGRIASASKAPGERRQIHLAESTHGALQKGNGRDKVKKAVQVAHTDAKVVNPEEVIPLNDKDLGDF